MEALRRRNRNPDPIQRRRELEQSLLRRMQEITRNERRDSFGLDHAYSGHDVVHHYAPSLLNTMQTHMTTPRLSDFTSRGGLLKLGARFVGSAVISKAKRIICREVCSGGYY